MNTDCAGHHGGQVGLPGPSEIEESDDVRGAGHPGDDEPQAEEEAGEQRDEELLHY
jgi:hypothetical protein